MVFKPVDVADLLLIAAHLTQPIGSTRKTWAWGAGQEIDANNSEICREDSMSHSEYLESAAWVKGEKKQWSPTVKMVLAFIIGLVVLSPALLGIYWQLLLPR